MLPLPNPQKKQKSIPANTPTLSLAQTPFRIPKQYDQRKIPFTDSNESATKKKFKPIYNTGINVYRVTKEQEGKSATLSKKNLKYLIKMKAMNVMDLENAKKFRNAKKILTVVRSGGAPQQIWVWIERSLTTPM